MYRSVFDISQVTPNRSFVAGLALMAGLGYAILVIRALWWRRWHVVVGGRWLLIAGIGLVTVAPAIGAIALISDQSGLKESQTALATGRTTAVEGPIRDFTPEPSDGHYPQVFTVAGMRFSYSDFVDTPCYHTTASRGGVGPQSVVRIHYYMRDSDPCIVKLEVR
jgi:hypothetical protein